MKKSLLQFAIWAGFSLVFTQSQAQNLVPNPGFETVVTCPSYITQVYNAAGWYNPSGHSGSADFHHVCATNAWVQVPNNVFGSQAAHGGNGYMGFALYYQSTPQFREYIYCQLTPVGGLTAGVSYQVTWWYSCADQSTMATNALQFYFSASAPTWSGNWNAMTSYAPQCSIPTTTYLSNKTAWTQVSATFTASGGERFMTLGNFRNDASTSVIPNGAGSYSTNYIYVDDGILQPAVVLSANLQNLKAEENGGAVRLSWETLNEITNDRFEIERSAGDYNHFERIGERAGAGNSSERLAYAFDDHGFTPGLINYYRLKVIDQNGESTYSNAVGVETSPNGAHLVNFYPNPAPAGAPIAFTFTSDKAQKVDLLLMDLQGRVVRDLGYEAQIGTNNFQFDTANLPAGQYLMRLQGGGAQAIHRITVL